MKENTEERKKSRHYHGPSWAQERERHTHKWTFVRHPKTTHNLGKSPFTPYPDLDPDPDIPVSHYYPLHLHAHPPSPQFI